MIPEVIESWFICCCFYVRLAIIANKKSTFVEKLLTVDHLTLCNL